MKHKNTPRGGAGIDPELREALDELHEAQDETMHQLKKVEEAFKELREERDELAAIAAIDKLFEADPEELGDAAVEEARKNEPSTPDQGDKRGR